MNVSNIPLTGQNINQVLARYNTSNNSLEANKLNRYPKLHKHFCVTSTKIIKRSHTQLNAHIENNTPKRERVTRKCISSLTHTHGITHSLSTSHMWPMCASMSGGEMAGLRTSSGQRERTAAGRAIQQINTDGDRQPVSLPLPRRPRRPHASTYIVNYHRVNNWETSLK